MTSQVRRAIEDLFQCPVCWTRINPPPRMCRRGHLMCKYCFRRLERCPVCRGRLSYTRNFVIETLSRQIRFPCSYVDYGCKCPPMPSITRKIHEVYCVHRPLTCPKSNCIWQMEAAIPSAQILSPISVLEKHLRTSHMTDSQVLRGFRLPFNIPISEEVMGVCTQERKKTLDYFVCFDRLIFMAALEFKNIKRGRRVRAGVTVLDRPWKGNASYHYSIRITGGQSELTYNAPVISYMQAWPGPIERPGHMAFHYALKLNNLSQYTTPNGTFNIHFIISTSPP